MRSTRGDRTPRLLQPLRCWLLPSLAQHVLPQPRLFFPRLTAHMQLRASHVAVLSSAHAAVESVACARC